MQTYITLYIPDAWWFLFQPVRIEGEEPGYGSDLWTLHDSRSGESLLLRADR